MQYEKNALLNSYIDSHGLHVHCVRAQKLDRTNDDDRDLRFLGPLSDILVGVGIVFRKVHIEERIKEVALAAIRPISLLSQWTRK
jgi:hypothetical protein